LQRGGVCCIVCRCVAVCCNVLQCASVCCSELRHEWNQSILQHTAMTHCTITATLQCTATVVCCSELKHKLNQSTAKTHCNNALQHTCNALQQTATVVCCNELSTSGISLLCFQIAHPLVHCKTSTSHTATHLQHTCNTLQHTFNTL